MYKISHYKALIKGISDCRIVEKNNKIFIQPPPVKLGIDWGCGIAEWRDFELGNGDVCGFYWKIGSEEENPLVCARHHHENELLPWSSSLVHFFKLIAANEIETDDFFVRNFWFNTEALDELLDDYSVVCEFQDLKKMKSLEDALLIDPESPVCLKYAADRYRKNESFDLAKEHYLKALISLPEYGDASFSLAMLYRAQRESSAAVPHFIDALASPFYFSKEKEKAIKMISSYKDDCLYDTQDPIWKRRHSLKMNDEEKNPHFFQMFNEIIEEYMDRKEYRRAISLRIYLGALAHKNERLCRRYSLKDHQQLLRQNLEMAGMEKRILLYGF